MAKLVLKNKFKSILDVIYYSWAALITCKDFKCLTTLFETLLRCKTVKCYRLKSGSKDEADDTDEEDEVRELVNMEKVGGHEHLEELPMLERDDDEESEDDEDSLEANCGSF